MDWFKKLVSKDKDKEPSAPVGSPLSSPSSSPSPGAPSPSISPAPSSSSTTTHSKPPPPTKEELKRLAEQQKAKEKELFAQLNTAWKQLEDCNPKDRPAKHVALMKVFLTLYDEHKISFKTIKAGFPGLTSGFQTAVCSFISDGFRNIMNHGTPSQSPKKRRTVKLDRTTVANALAQSSSSNNVPGASSQSNGGEAQASRLYSFLSNEASHTLRVLVILSQELLEIHPLVTADMPTTLVNIYQRLWQLPGGVIQADSLPPTSPRPTSSTSAPSPAFRPEVVVITILLQLCSSKASIVKLMETDAFGRLFTMPLMYSEENQTLRDRILPVTTTVIKCNIDQSVIDYLLKKDCISTLVEMMANNFEKFSTSNILDSCTMILTLLEESVKISPELIEEFNNMQGYNLLTKALIVLEEKSTVAASGSLSSSSAALLPSSSSSTSPQASAEDSPHSHLLDYIKDFVFIGPEPLYPEYDSENKYNPPMVKRDPLTGKVVEDPGALMVNAEDGTKLRRARNAEAFQVMQNCFFGSKFDKTKELILDCMASLFSAHPGNFYALQHLRTLAHFVEDIPHESPAVRDGIHQLLLCCATYINVIPFYALVSLWNVFDDAVPKAKMSVLEGCFNTFYVLLNYDSRYRTILTDAGVLNGLINVLQRYHKTVAKMLMSSTKLASKGPAIRKGKDHHHTGTLKRVTGGNKDAGSSAGPLAVEAGSSNPSSPLTPPHHAGTAPPGLGAPKRAGSGAGSGSISLRKFGARGALARLKIERLREQTRVCEELLADKSIESLDINAAFPAVTDLLSLMVTDCPENTLILKQANGSQALHNLMQQTETRSGALGILVQLIRHDVHQSEGDMGNLLLTLSSHSDIELRRDILLALLDLFETTPATKRSFREFGGFASVMTTVVLLKTRLDKISLNNDPSGYSYHLDTLRLILSVITAAMASHRVNRLHMAAHGGWPLLETQIKETGLWDSNPELYIDWMFLMATENMTYVQTIPSSASSFAKSKLAKDAATLISDNGALLDGQNKAFKKRTERYQNAVHNYIDFYTSQNGTGEAVNVAPKDLLSILLAMDFGDFADHPIDQKSTWMHILPIDDQLPIIYNPGPLAGLLSLLPTVPLAKPKTFADQEEEEEEASLAREKEALAKEAGETTGDAETSEKKSPTSEESRGQNNGDDNDHDDNDGAEEGEDSTSSTSKSTSTSKASTTVPPIANMPSTSGANPVNNKPSFVHPNQVHWHLHILFRLTDYARGNVGNLEALSSLGLAGKAMRKWTTHLKSLGSPLHAPLLYLVELIMAYRPDTLEVTQYLSLFEPSTLSSAALQALLQSLLRSASAGLARLAPFFLFDMSRHGFGSMSTTLTDVAWPFTEGYSVSMWCYFERFSPDDVELFRIAPQGASSFHPVFSQGDVATGSPKDGQPSANAPGPSNCIVSAVLKTGQLVLRNAGADDALTVETFNFATGKWYHIAIVHERSRFQFTYNAETKVYVDGIQRGAVKANMGAPVNGTNLHLTVGTPEEVHGVQERFAGVSAAWRLGPFSLLDQSLSNADVLTIFNLGPSYFASYQGSLVEYFYPEVVNSQYLLALETIKGEAISEAELSKMGLQHPFPVDRVALNINAVKHVLQMHPSSRNLPNFAFLRDASGKRGIAPLFAVTSDAIRGTAVVASGGSSSSSSTIASASASAGASASASAAGTGKDDPSSSGEKGQASSSAGAEESAAGSAKRKRTAPVPPPRGDRPQPATTPSGGNASSSSSSSSTTASGLEKPLTDSQDDLDGADVNTAALANAAGVLAGLGSPITEGGSGTGPGGAPGSSQGPSSQSSSKSPADNFITKPPLTLHFENGDSPIACWPQPLQTVLYRSNGVDMLLYLFEFVTACEASTVASTFNPAPPAQPSSSTAASAHQLETSSDQGEAGLSTPVRGSATGSSGPASSFSTPPTSARQSVQIPSSLAGTAPSTPTSLPDSSMALLVLRCIRAILRSNPQAYLDFGEKNSYSVVCHVLKRFPAQLTEEKIKLFFDVVGVVPNGFTGPSYSSSPSEEVMQSFMTNFDTGVLSTLPKAMSESLWSLALHQIPSGSLSTGTLSNIVAFKNFFMDYRMWRKAPLRLQELILDYTDRLIQGNLLYQFNVSRMRKTHMLTHLLNMLREEGLDMSLFLRVVGLISDLLVAHHTEKDLQHIAGFLIHTFHLQNNPAPLPNASAAKMDAHARLDQLAIRFDILRNMLLNVIFYLVADAENKSFYEKVFDPDWINLFAAQEANPDTVTTSLKIMAQLYYGSSAYSLRVEKTNALKHFAAIFPVFHAHVPLYYYLFGMTLGKPPTELPERLDHFDFSALLEVFKLQSAEEEYPIVCRGALEVIFAMIKASSEAYIDTNDAAFVTSASTTTLEGLLLHVGSGTSSPAPMLGSAVRSASSSSDNIALITGSASFLSSQDHSAGGSSSMKSTSDFGTEESPRVSLDGGAGDGAYVSGMTKSSSASIIPGGATPPPGIAQLNAMASRRMSADVSAELSRRRASSMAVPRPIPGLGQIASSSSVGSSSGSILLPTTPSSSHLLETTIVEEDPDSSGPHSEEALAAAAGALGNLVGLGGRNIISSTQGMGTALLNAFKGIKSSRRKSTVVSSFVPQQVIGGTMSGASITSRSQPKFQDKYHLYTPPLYYQEQSFNMSANFAPHRSLLQFIKHIFSRSSAMQDLIRKADLAHHILTILFPHGRLNMPASGAAWGSSANTSPVNLSASSPSPVPQSGADQWSLLIMDFLSHVLIQQAILNPFASKDTSLLHEIFEVAPPIFSTHADLSRFNAILLHFIYDQIRPKLNILLASTAHNQLPKLLAPLARFCSFAIDRVSCSWVQPSTAPLTLSFITDVMTTVQDKLDEETRKKTISSKDATSVKNELNQFTKCLNRLVMWMLQDALREKLPAAQASALKLEVLGKIMGHKRLIFSPSNNDKDFYGTLAKGLHTLLTDLDGEVRTATLATWKLLLLDKLDQVEFGLVYKSPKGETIDLRHHGFLILIQPITNDAHQAGNVNVNTAFTKWFRDNSMIISTIFEDTFGRISKNYWANELKLLEERKSLSRKNMKLRTMKSQKMDDAEKISLDRIMEDNARLKQRILQAETLRFQQSKQAVVEMERYYNRKWAQRRLTLFHELHIWGATTQDPETDSPLFPGLAPVPHPLHKWMLDLTEGPNRMRSKTKRNYDFYDQYPYDPLNLQASAQGPIIYPTRTPQSTSAKDFDSLSIEERTLVDRNFYIERAIRRHQAMAIAQLHKGRFASTAQMRKSAKIPIADGDRDDDDDEDESSEEEQFSFHSGGGDSSSDAAEGSAPASPRSNSDGDQAEGSVTPRSDASDRSSNSSRSDPEDQDDDDEEGQRGKKSKRRDSFDPEQAAFEGLNRLGKLIPADQRNLKTKDDEDVGGGDTDTAPSTAPLTSSGRRRSNTLAPSTTSSMLRGSSKASISEKAAPGSVTARGTRGEGTSKKDNKAGELSTLDSDDDTAHDMSLVDDDALGGDATLKKNLEDVVAATQMPEMEMETDEGDQKLKRLLQPGDEPTDMYNCGRVVGLDKKDGIFVICENNAYFIQDYHVTKDHELVEVLTSNGTQAQTPAAPNVNLDQSKRVIRWAHEDVEQVLRRRYLLRPVAIEIFSVDGRNSLLVFDLADRERVINVMGIKQQVVANRIASATGVARSAKSLKLSLKESTDLWTSGQISNFEYLMRLNTIAGRSYNDLTQYPVFPWIVADYKSQTLDLSNPASYRDLTKPMGALGEERRIKLLERYEMLDDEVPKFHYGSHYSSAAIVLHYLIRLEPMTQQFLTLQGGRFDRPDRLFESIGDSWIAASTENPMDVKELVPEFFYLPEAFHNSNNFIFGRKQTGDEAFIDDVILPPWANGDAHTFVRLNRQALESQYVSENLHHWIDLIFGYKQQGPAAEQAMNLFYYLTYEGAVDIDKIQDAVEKQGIIDQINNFGQTPTQLFKKSHPKRQVLPKIVPSLFGISSGSGFSQYSGVVGASVTTTTGATTAAGGAGASTSTSATSLPTSGTLPRIQSGDLDSPSTTSGSTSPPSMPSTPLDAPSSFGSPRLNTAQGGSNSGDSSNSSGDGAQPPGSGKLSTSSTSNPVNAVASEAPARTVIGWSVLANKGVSLGSSIGQICANNSDKVVALEMMKIALPGHLNRRIAWGYDDLALRFWDGEKLVLVVPNTFHRSGIISCVAISADGKFVVTGGTDAVLCVFRLDWEARKPHFALAAATGSTSSKLTGHCAPIAHVTVSRAFSMIVSSDTTGQVLLWDLNTFQFVRTLCGPSMPPGSTYLGSGALNNGQGGPSNSASSGLSYRAGYGPAYSSSISPGTPRSASRRLQIYHEHQYSVDGDIRAAMAEASVEDGLAPKSSSKNIDMIRIDDSNGTIYTSSQGNLCIWDLNGELLAMEEVSLSSTVSSFTTTHCPDWMEGVNFLIVGLKDGSIKVYRRDNSPRLEGVSMVEGKWPALPPSKLLLHTIFENRHKAPVTALCLTPNQKKLYSGDANGILLKWEEIKVSEAGTR